MPIAVGAVESLKWEACQDPNLYRIGVATAANAMKARNIIAKLIASRVRLIVRLILARVR